MGPDPEAIGYPCGRRRHPRSNDLLAELRRDAQRSSARAAGALEPLPILTRNDAEMLFNAWPGILEEARRAIKRSQEKAAEKAGVSTATWYRWESGAVYPGAHQLENMARGVDLPAEELAWRYAVALLRHYRDDGDARPPRRRDHPPGEAAAAPGERRRREFAVRGISRDLGPIWVDLRDFVETFSAIQKADESLAEGRGSVPSLRVTGRRRDPSD